MQILMASPVVAFFFTVVLLFFNNVYGTGLEPDQEQCEVLEFSYVGAKGPEQWGSLDPKFSACSNGKSQSPINIEKGKAVLNNKLKPLTRRYKAANATLVNNGCSVGLRYGEHAGVMNLDGRNYTLKQMHWHSPSEHHIDGVQYAAELHLVHVDDNGNYAVVAMLYDHGNPDPLISKIQKSLLELAKEKCASHEEAHIPIGNFHINKMRFSNRKYYRYIGSLTTPPCYENVTWNVLEKVRSISKQQVEALKAPLGSPYKNNCRPVQPLNGRPVEFCNMRSSF